MVMDILLHDCCNQHHVYKYIYINFVYRKREDAVYCINCALFSPTDKRRTMGSFVNTGHKGWNNIHEKQTLHIDDKDYDDAANYHKV